MKVSVVIPAYNEEAYIGACLDSLLKQQIPPDEIIVVDNNSTDNTAKIVKKYPVRLLREKKQGRASARNKGFNAAKYEIIARTDADSIAPPKWIKKIKQNFLDEKLIALSGHPRFYDFPDKAEKAYRVSARIGFNAYIRITKSILHHDIINGFTMAIRKNAWDKIKNDVCLDEDEIHEDLDLAIHLAPLGNIKLDKTFTVRTSFRRWESIEKWVNYTYRVISSITKHKQFKLEHKSKKFAKKFLEKIRSLDQEHKI